MLSFSTENEVVKNGYVRPVLVTTLPSYISPSPAYSAHSPDSHRNTPSVQSRCVSPSALVHTEHPAQAPNDYSAKCLPFAKGRLRRLSLLQKSH